MMPEITISTISDILDSFDVTEVKELFADQILRRDSYSGIVLDQFQPLYFNYNKLLQSEDADPDEIREGEEKFDTICDLLMATIEEKFGISVDENYLADHGRNKPAIALALYNFFVLDIYGNLKELLRNYILRNQSDLYQKFKDIPRKSIANTSLTPNGEVIFRNIYDICTYILSELTSDAAFDYMDDGYLPMKVVRNLADQQALDGDFIAAIADIFNSDTAFKSQMGFDLMYDLRQTSLMTSDKPSSDADSQNTSNGGNIND